MKKQLYIFALLVTILFSVSSLKFQSEESKVAFEKTFFIEINTKNDSALFVPYSKAWSASWRYLEEDLFADGAEMMNAEKYMLAFDQRNENLYTLLHPKVITGQLTLYSPYDPAMLGLSGFDDGELLYPVKGKTESDNFLNSQELRNEMCYYLGQFGPASEVPLIDDDPNSPNFGEYLTKTLPDGTVAYVYPAPDYWWFKDSDITKYKLRVKVIVNKKGKEKKRIIKSIAPMTNEIDNGQIVGERELFWLDFNELTPYLEEGYFFNENGKPITYLEHIEEIVKTTVFK